MYIKYTNFTHTQRTKNKYSSKMQKSKTFMLQGLIELLRLAYKTHYNHIQLNRQVHAYNYL